MKVSCRVATLVVAVACAAVLLAASCGPATASEVAMQTEVGALEDMTVDQLVKALYNSKQETIAATPTVSPSEPTFLELANSATGAKHEKCADGTLCPIKGGQCCGGGKMCCPASHPCQPTNPPSCGTHGMITALALAKAKALEEVVKTKEHEEHVKATSETGIKQAAEEKLKKESKHTMEQNAKNSEQRTKKSMADQEESIKQHASEAEERSKARRKKDEHGYKKDESETKQRKEKARLERRQKRIEERRTKKRSERAAKRSESADKAKYKQQEEEKKNQQKEAEKQFAEKQKAMAEAKRKAADKLQWQHGWRDYNGGYARGRVSRIGPLCVLSGLGRRGGYRGLIAQLPKNCLPRSRIMIDAHSASGWTQRLDILSNGQIHWISGRTGASWMPLDGISFVRKDQNHINLHLGHNWYAPGGTWSRPSVTYSKDYCQLQGLVYTRNWGSRVIARVPSRCRPRDGRLIFNANHHIDTARVDILTNGLVYWVNKQGGRSFPWNFLSLSSFGWFNRSPTKLHLMSGWRPYARGYRHPSFRVQDHMCVLSGLMRGNRWTSWMARLPGHCRPRAGRMIFMVNNHAGRWRASRIDVLSNGLVRWSGGSRSHGWVSLDGIRFDTRKD